MPSLKRLPVMCASGLAISVSSWVSRSKDAKPVSHCQHQPAGCACHHGTDVPADVQRAVLAGGRIVDVKQGAQNIHPVEHLLLLIPQRPLTHLGVGIHQELDTGIHDSVSPFCPFVRASFRLPLIIESISPQWRTLRLPNPLRVSECAGSRGTTCRAPTAARPVDRHGIVHDVYTYATPAIACVSPERLLSWCESGK